jgi:hypothetical protein
VAGSGPLKRKSIQKRLREVRAQSTVPLVWLATPGWVIGPGAADILLPLDDRSGGTDTAAVATVTRPEYVAALVVAVAEGDIGRWHLEPEAQERSWQLFLHFREGTHSPSCGCYVGQPTPDPTPPQKPTSNRLDEVWNETGLTNRRSDRGTHEIENPYDAEQRRLREIAALAPIRYF